MANFEQHKHKLLECPWCKKTSAPDGAINTNQICGGCFMKAGAEHIMVPSKKRKHHD